MEQRIYERTSLLLLFLSCLYLMLELVFNVSLLDIAGTASSTQLEIERVQTFGRVVSGFGFTLLILGVFARGGFCLNKVVFRYGAYGLLVLGVLPFVMATGFGPFASVAAHERDPELIWGILPILGGGMIFWRWQKLMRLRVAIGIILIAWPAMFFGQKILIERYVVEPTSAEDRLNAQYMSALRTAFEYCLLEIGDLTFCDDGYNRPEARSILGMSSALFMQKPQMIVDLIANNRDSVLRSLSMNSRLFAPERQYEAYLEMAAGRYEAYLTALAKTRNQLFQTYTDAVRAYQEKVSPEAQAQLSQQIQGILDQNLDLAWETYNKAQDLHKEISLSMARMLKKRILKQRERAKGDKCLDGKCGLLERLASGLKKHLSGKGALAEPLQEILPQICGGASPQIQNTPNNAHQLKQAKELGGLAATAGCEEMDDEELAERIAVLTSGRFEKETGYPIGIETRDEFVRHPQTRNFMHEKLPKILAQYFPLEDEGIKLEWSYDRSQDLIDHIVHTISSKAEKSWRETMNMIFGDDLPAGLPFADFIEHPAITKLVKDFVHQMGLDKGADFALSREGFIEKIMIPNNTEIILGMLDDMKQDALLYGNGDALSEQGKEHIRAAYIPAIALALSLFILILTVAKNSSALFDILIVRTGGSKNLRLLGSTIVWSLAFVCIIYLPWQLKGPGNRSQTYQYVLGEISKESPYNALAIDWTLRMQPVVYRLGQEFISIYKALGLVDPFGVMPNEKRHYVPQRPEPRTNIDINEMLREVQVDLAILDYLPDEAITGLPNSMTDDAINRFKAANDLPPGDEITPDFAYRLMIYSRTLLQTHKTNH